MLKKSFATIDNPLEPCKKIESLSIKQDEKRKHSRRRSILSKTPSAKEGLWQAIG